MDNDNLTNNSETLPTENETPQEEITNETQKPEEPVTEVTAEEPKAEEPAAEAPAEEPKAEEPAAEAPAEEPKAEEPAAEAPEEEPKAEEPAEKPVREDRFAAVHEELAQKKETGETIEVTIKERIRGGLRVVYKEAPLFLPASHFSLRRNPPEKQLKESVNTTITVEIHEIQEYDEGRKAVIVSRKRLMMDDFWNNLKEGDVVEGKISSVASFGVFVDLGGVEGLIHISRLSQVHVDDPSKFVNKGDKIQAVVVEVNREKSRIALSRRELEESPWSSVEEDFPVDSVQKGIVRRLTDFGAYIELKPGVDGLLRTPEISWTKRVKRPEDVLKKGQEIDVKIVAASAEKRTLSLSYKQTLENPWPKLVEKYPVGAEFDAEVLQVIPQGMIVTVENDIDGFMPRSKMKRLLQGNKIPFQSGDKLKVLIADLIPADESLILSPKIDENDETFQRRIRKSKKDSGPKVQDPGISLGDMIPEGAFKDLKDSE